MRKTTIHSHDAVPGGHIAPPDQAAAYSMIQEATAELNSVLESLEKRAAAPNCDLDALTAELTEQMHQVCQICHQFETELGDEVAVRRSQAEFRRRTDQYFCQSFLVNRARKWPRGYPGDYEIIDAVYDNDARSNGLGLLFDRYFLNTTLARAIQKRREKMREMLAAELQDRRNARVLNIGCGPCREVLELAPLIKQSGAHFTNIDFDTDALMHSSTRLTEAGIGDHVEFRQYNAIRMVSAKKNIREFGQADVIYAIGLFDYLSDEIIVRLLKSLYATLKPGGALIAVFKDCDYYTTEDYHWMSDWSAFLQRTGEESRVLLEEAHLPADSIRISRTSDNVMIFYHAVQTAETSPTSSLQGPHDRRQGAAETQPEAKQTRRNKPNRPSWHRPGQTT